jgi:hypothetical protein
MGFKFILTNNYDKWPSFQLYVSQDQVQLPIPTRFDRASESTMKILPNSSVESAWFSHRVQPEELQ